MTTTLKPARLVGIGAIAVLLLLTIAPTHAQALGGGSVTVTPSTGLVDQQSVTVAGSGFTSGSTVGVCQAIPGPVGIDGCGVIDAQIGTAAGGFSITIRIHQFLYVQRLGRVVDCRVEPCVIVVAEVNGIDPIPGTEVFVPIEFAAAPPPPATRGSIKVTPSVDLIDGQSIAVAGSGFRPDVQVEVLLCMTVPTSQLDCNSFLDDRTVVTTDDAGSFAVDVISARWISPPGAQVSVDCLSVAEVCSYAAGESADVAGTIASVPISFQAEGPSNGSLTVTPHDGLVDGQGVTVDGTGFRLSRSIGFCQGIAGATGPESCGLPILFATSSSTGAFTSTYQVSRFINVGRPVDCGIEACVIIAAETDDIAGSITETPISFAVETPPVVLPGVASVVEGDSGTTTLEVPVTLSKPSSTAVTVRWTTLHAAGAPSGQARTPSDYHHARGTVTFEPGQTIAYVSIEIKGDHRPERDEYLAVSFNHPTNAVMGGFWGLGFGVILNDDVRGPMY